VSVADLQRSNRLRHGGAMQTLVELGGCGLDVHQATVRVTFSDGSEGTRCINAHQDKTVAESLLFSK
jgi:hypothetical protein